jgi:outer membrane protein assembly factor BamA
MGLLRSSRVLLSRAGWFLVLVLTVIRVAGQDTVSPGIAVKAGSLVIQSITITGNKITKRGIILREITFKEKDTLSVAGLQAALKASQQNVFNTNLFNFVTMDTCILEGTRLVEVHVSVVERWYIWPIPLLEISDRNFNVWWQTRDLSHLTYGVDFTFNNVRGRNETLRMLVHLGYNQVYGFTYKIPYINRRQTIGLSFGSGIALNHEIAVTTVDNKPVYRKDTSVYLRKTIYAYTELQLRPDYYSMHFFRLSYNYYFFGEDVYKVPGFSLVDSSRQQFVTISYFYRNDHRDVSYYPLKGYSIEVELNHAMPYATAHNSYVRTILRKYWQIYNRWYFASGFTGKLSFEKEQPYYLQRALGYGRDVVRGYGYYVVDGQHFVLLKSNLKFALVPQKVIRIGFIKTTKFNTIPLALYLNAFADAGYVYNYQHVHPGYIAEGNTLENSWLAGIGLGIDLTTYYDVVIRVEGALNRMGQTGIFVNFTAPI